MSSSTNRVSGRASGPSGPVDAARAGSHCTVGQPGVPSSGGGAERIPLADDLAVDSGRSLDLIALDEALDRLAQRDERKAKVVEQRFFAGMEMSQIAENLGVSLATVKRDWEYARTWLAREIDAGE
ncbi:MAG: ECF-type sigma factor [Phycisphaerae bacterium]